MNWNEKRKINNPRSKLSDYEMERTFIWFLDSCFHFILEDERIFFIEMNI
jgi:hypothetical protein